MRIHPYRHFVRMFGVDGLGPPGNQRRAKGPIWEGVGFGLDEDVRQ